MRIDYTGYTFITTTSEDRLNLLHATLTNVMSYVTGARFVIQWLAESKGEAAPNLSGLSFIAKHSGNTIEVNCLDSVCSVATSKHAFEIGDATHFVNLDDDLSITYHSLEMLRRYETYPAVSIGVVDANNSRGFADYDEAVYGSMEEFLLKHEFSKAKHHFFANPDFVEYFWMSQLYCLRRDVFLDDEVWGPIREAFAKKGVRGYDIMLEQVLVRRSYAIGLIVGCEAIHLGMEHAFIGGQWTSVNKVAEGVVDVRV
jgi:hypothetical protein